MEPRELATLRAVRTQGGVSAAALALHLTPSAVSQQLAALQREVAVPLTERVGRSLQLTAAGHALADAALGVAVALERARAAADEFLDRPGGTVRVSAFSSGAQLLLPPLLARVGGIAGGGSGDDITLECTDEDVALDDFVALTDRIDIVIAHRADGEPTWGGGVQVHPLLREPLDVAVPATHEFAAREQLRPADLADERWIAVREGFPVLRVLDAVAAATGSVPQVAHRINDFHVSAALVGAGEGICLLPRYTFASTADVRLVPLADVRAARYIEALVRPDRAERLAVRRVLAELGAVSAQIAA